MLAKLEYSWETHAGNFSAYNMVYNRMGSLNKNIFVGHGIFRHFSEVARMKSTLPAPSTLIMITRR